MLLYASAVCKKIREHRTYACLPYTAEYLSVLIAVFITTSCMGGLHNKTSDLVTRKTCSTVDLGVSLQDYRLSVASNVVLINGNRLTCSVVKLFVVLTLL